jgi:hypothetical protein
VPDHGFNIASFVMFSITLLEFDGGDTTTGWIIHINCLTASFTRRHLLMFAGFMTYQEYGID